MSSYISHKDTNKVIRAALREAFPGVKFSVSGSDGLATDVRWTDGPAEAQVKAVAGRYKAGKGLDPTGDYTETGDSTTDRAFTATNHDGTTTDYSPGDTVNWGPTYVSAVRELSEEALEAGWGKLEELMGYEPGTLDRKGQLTGDITGVEVFTGDRFSDYTLRASFAAYRVAARLVTAAYNNEPASAREAEEAAEAAALAAHTAEHLDHPNYPAEFGDTCRWCATPAREAAYAAAGVEHTTEHIGAPGYPGAFAGECGWCQDAAEGQEATGEAAEEQRAGLWHQNVHCNDPGYPFAHEAECPRCATAADQERAADAEASAADLNRRPAPVVLTIPESRTARQEAATAAAAAEAAAMGFTPGTAVVWTTRQGERTTGRVRAVVAQGDAETAMAVLHVPGNPLGARVSIYDLRTVAEDAAWRAEAASYRAHQGADAATRAAGWSDQAGAFADAAEAFAAETGAHAYIAVRLAATAATAAATAAAATAAALVWEDKGARAGEAAETIAAARAHGERARAAERRRATELGN